MVGTSNLSTWNGHWHSDAYMIIDAAVRHWHVGMQPWFMKLMIQTSSRRDCKTLPPDSHMASYSLLRLARSTIFPSFPKIRSQVDHWRTRVHFCCSFCSSPSCLIARNMQKIWCDYEAGLLLALHASWFKTQLAHTTSSSTNCHEMPNHASCIFKGFSIFFAMRFSLSSILAGMILIDFHLRSGVGLPLWNHTNPYSNLGR